MRFETGISASSSAKEENIEDHLSPRRVEKHTFCLGGCLHLVVLFDIIAGLCFHNFLSLCSLQFPWPVVSVGNWLHRLMEPWSKHIHLPNSTGCFPKSQDSDRSKPFFFVPMRGRKKILSKIENKVTVVKGLKSRTLKLPIARRWELYNVYFSNLGSKQLVKKTWVGSGFGRTKGRDSGIAGLRKKNKLEGGISEP